MDKQMDRQTDGHTDTWTGGQMDKQMDRHINFGFKLPALLNLPEFLCHKRVDKLSAAILPIGHQLDLS
jgi:hypothetical protein